jgi:RNA polymerase sigma factor (sigma-70 family)
MNTPEVRDSIITKYACDMVRADDESSLIPDHDLARNTVWGMLRDGELYDFQAADLFSAAYEGLVTGATYVDLSKSEGEQVAFLIQCIKNQVRDFLRVERKYRQLFTFIEEIGDPASLDWKGISVQSILKAEISKLPEKYQQVFDLKFNDPMTTAEEIGLALGIKTKTVESLLRRGRRMIRKVPREKNMTGQQLLGAELAANKQAIIAMTPPRFAPPTDDAWKAGLRPNMRRAYELKLQCKSQVEIARIMRVTPREVGAMLAAAQRIRDAA